MDIKMSMTEIVLIIAGVIVMFLGYILPSRKKDMDDELQLISEDEVRKLVDRELEGIKQHISDIIDETVTYAIEKTERSMERMANEKMMAINEYSDTVLEEINKNHKEVLFLYDMLNDKQENLKAAVSEASKLEEGLKQTLRDAEIIVREAGEAAREATREVEETVKEVGETAQSRIDTIFDDDFVPIMPPRVEIVHDPESDYDYVAPESDSEELIGKLSKESEKEPWQDDEIELPRRLSSSKRVSAMVDDNEWSQFAPVNNGVHDTNISREKFEAAFMSAENENEGNRNNNDIILELHKAGKSNMMIAKELGLGIGEVKLVIDLFEEL